MAEPASFTLSFEDDEPTFALGVGEGGAAGDYIDLINKPRIEHHVLVGNSTIDQIGVGTLSVQEIEKILYLN